MKKRDLFQLFVLSFLLFLLITPNISWSQEYREITVSGSADIVGGNEEQAKKLAVHDALRTAVEMGVGVVIQSSTDVKDFEVIKDEIKSNAEGYVKEYEIIKEGTKKGRYSVTLRTKVMTEKINEAFKKRLGKASQAMGNPSIAFVLTTWKKIGEKGGFESKTEQLDVSTQASDSDASMRVTKYRSSATRLSETEWKKYPDLRVITSFQQEFKEKGFDFMAADEARRIAQAESLSRTSIDVFDREQVIKSAEKAGANYVARGEVKIIDYRISESTGKPVITAEVDVEIIDVNSADGVASYVNTTKATGSSREEAETQAIKTISVLAARTLANQTLETWEKRGSVGQFYTIEVHNITNTRKQQRPLLKAIESIASIRQQTNPSDKVLLIQVYFKGTKNELGDAILDKLEKDRTPGFSGDEFDGPKIEGGKIVFKFTNIKGGFLR